jgi:hypothetical protein
VVELLAAWAFHRKAVCARDFAQFALARLAAQFNACVWCIHCAASCVRLQSAPLLQEWRQLTQALSALAGRGAVVSTPNRVCRLYFFLKFSDVGAF